MTGLIVSLVVVIFSLFLYANNTYSELQQGKAQVLKIKAGMLMLRRNEKDFLARNNLKYLKKFEKNHQKILQDLQFLESILKNNDLSLEKVTLATAIFNQYKVNFITLTETQKLVGLDHQSGLQGRLRKSVHQVESKIKVEKNDILMAQMLMLRRREKDFLLRFDLKYLKKFNPDILTFNCKIINNNKKFKHPYNYLRSFKKYKLSKSLSYLSHLINNNEFTPVVWLYIFKAKLIKKKRNFIEEISPADDNAFIYEVLTKNSNIVYVNEKIIFHRSHDNSIMKKIKKARLLNSTQIMLMKLVKYSKSISRFYKDIELFRFFNAVCFMFIGQVGLFKFIKISKKNNFFYFLCKNIFLFNIITLKFFLKGMLYNFKNKRSI